MSGFALAFDYQEAMNPQDHFYSDLKKGVVRYKYLSPTCHEVLGPRCIAVKFDTPISMHQGVTVDDQTGSWLLAVGTVLDNKNGSDDANLQSLLNRYLNQGNDAITYLDGTFALVIYDKTADKLAIVSDPLGSISIFYAIRGNRVYIATSALAIAEVIQATPSEYGVYLFLTTGNVFGKSTLWQEVNRLSAGTILEFSKSGCSESVYWYPIANDEINKLPLVDTVNHAIDLLSHSIKACTKREATSWTDLTGGFDSRLITAILIYCGIPFKATCEGPSTSPDVRISSHIASELGFAYQHDKMPDNWGRERYKFLFQALGKGDGHYDIIKLSGVIWDQIQKAQVFNTSLCGLGGGLWRGFMWKQEMFNIGRSPTVNYDRLVDYRILHPIRSEVFKDSSRLIWIREELKSLLKSVGDRYVDSPNTLKLDCILTFRTMSHSGAYISSSLGIQKVFAPLILKDTTTFAISTNYHSRNQSRLVSNIIEKVNPVLANFETNSGCPAAPLRASNFTKFIPYWTSIGMQLLRKTSPSFIRRYLLPQVRDEFSDYPRLRWRLDTLKYLEEDGILDYTQMRSGALYDSLLLADFIKEAHTEQFGHETFLSRILTVEMAMRAVGASL